MMVRSQFSIEFITGVSIMLIIYVVALAGYIAYRLNVYGDGNSLSFLEFLINPSPNLPVDGVIIGLLIPFLIVTAHQVINDVFDYESDLANNRYDRPIVREAISLKGARNIAIIEYLLSILLTAFINSWSLP